MTNAKRPAVHPGGPLRGVWLRNRSLAQSIGKTIRAQVFRQKLLSDRHQATCQPRDDAREADARRSNNERAQAEARNIRRHGSRPPFEEISGAADGVGKHVFQFGVVYAVLLQEVGGEAQQGDRAGQAVGLAS
jgi:hypothetical protein